MGTSDFLTLLGLSLAIWAIIPNKERQFILLFFSKLELWILFTTLIFIHYLISFNWILKNWFPKLEIFTFNHAIPSNIWAYIVSLIVITYPITKVTFGYFSGSRVEELIELYKKYLKENEIEILVNYIKKYHIQDINTYLKEKSRLPNKDSINIVLRRRTERDMEYEKLVKPKRILFAAWAYGNIVQNEIFIKKAANNNPELFAIAINGMETVEASNPEFVKLYIDTLFKYKNQSLVNELKILNDSLDSVETRNNHIDIPITYSLFVHTKVAKANGVWYPVGEEVIKSLKHDTEQREFLLKNYDGMLQEELWNQKIYIAIIYFDYMVKETIYKNSNYHMWLHYFKYYIEELIDLIPEENTYEHTTGYPSFIHYVINDLFSRMIGWLELSKEQNNDNRVIDTVRCLGESLYILCESPETKISLKFKTEILNSILSIYFEFSNHNGNIGADTSRRKLEQLFINPKNMDWNSPTNNRNYLNILFTSWNDFDKVPYQYHEDNGSIKTFGEQVLQRLNIQK